MKCRLYLKRVLSAVILSVMLCASVGSSFSHGYEAAASAGVETLGGASLFEFLLGLFGVSVPVLGASHRPGSPEALYNEYLETLKATGADDGLTMQEYMDLVNGDTVSITSGVIDSVQDFLEGKFGSLSSGSVQNVYSGYICDHVLHQSVFTDSFIDYVSGLEDNFFVFFNCDQWFNAALSGDVYYFGPHSEYDYFSSFDSSSFLVVSYVKMGNGIPLSSLYVVSYDSLGLPVSVSNVNFNRYDYKSGWKLNRLSGDVILGRPSQTSFYTNFPVIVANDNLQASNLGSVPLQELLSGASSVPEQAISGVSFGDYSQSLINSVAGKVLSLDAVSAANTAVRSTVEMNTLEDEETGAFTYTDVIADAVSDAIARALADAGVIEGDITKPGEGEGEGEEEGEKPLPFFPEGLMELLETMGGAIVDGFEKIGEWIMDIPEAIGGFFVSLWEWLQKIWDAICALPGQIADAFEGFFAPPGESETPGEGGEPPDNTPFLADLSELFPFCVPFDLIRLFKVLQSAPQAPYWEIPLDVPSIGLHYKFVIDMSQFDTLAQLLRICETIGFICGLILITRKLIRG